MFAGRVSRAGAELVRLTLCGIHLKMCINAFIYSHLTYSYIVGCLSGLRLT